MSSVERPLSDDACSKADDEIYAKHANDPRPNALFDEHGNRLKLDAIDPAQEELRQEWMSLYAKHGGRTDEPKTKPDKPCDDPVEPCPVLVTVTIQLAEKVACPGHPLEMTAVGTPPGGFFTWIASGGGAVLVDGSGNPTVTGATVFLRSFQPDDATGIIPEQKVNIKVDYTHTSGNASVAKKVRVHEIKYNVSSETIHKDSYKAYELTDIVKFGNKTTDKPIMETNPKVKIKIDKSCPRKVNCAGNSHVGWIQNVTKNFRQFIYKESIRSLDLLNLPRVDSTSAGHVPFVFGSKSFSKNNDSFVVPLNDTPRDATSWEDLSSYAAPLGPLDIEQLEKVLLTNEFQDWLFVINRDWFQHDPKNSFVFLRHFKWDFFVDSDVDTFQSRGNRCTMITNIVDVGSGKLIKGKGAKSPKLTGKIARGNFVLTETKR